MDFCKQSPTSDKRRHRMVCSVAMICVRRHTMMGPSASIPPALGRDATESTFDTIGFMVHRPIFVLPFTAARIKSGGPTASHSGFRFALAAQMFALSEKAHM